MNGPAILIAAADPAAAARLSLALPPGASCATVAPTAVTAATLARAPAVCLLLVRESSVRLELIEELRRRAPATALVVVADEIRENELVHALRAGASGYVASDVSPERLWAVISSVAAGGVAVPRRVVGRLLAEIWTDRAC